MLPLEHVKQGLYLLGRDPLPENPSQQLRDAYAAVGLPPNYCETDQNIFCRGWVHGSLGAELSGQFGGDKYQLYCKGWQLGLASRCDAIPPSDVAVWEARTSQDTPQQLDAQSEHFRRVCIPLTFGRGADTFVVPVNHGVRLLRPMVEHGGNRYALASWGGYAILVAEPERKLAQCIGLIASKDRFELLFEIFEGTDPGVWGEDRDILAVVREDIPTCRLMDVREARTRYRTHKNALPWVLARIENLKAWKRTAKTSKTWGERWASLPEDIRNLCCAPR